ncbi:MAG: exported protein of unknown function [Nitrosopumilales archaeon]|nr:MAG: exported protein of unknown function [Nitrosopumilales archaeon]
MTQVLKTHRIYPIFGRTILLSFMILLTLTSVISLQMQEAYAVPPTFTAVTGDSAAGNSAATNQVIVTFSEVVNATNTNTAASWGVAGFNVQSVTNILSADCPGGAGGTATMTITLTTAMAADAIPRVTYNSGGGADPVISNCSLDEDMVDAIFDDPTDGLSPTVSAAATTSPTTIVLTMTEPMTENVNDPGDFTIGGVATNPTVTASVVAGTSITLTTSAAIVNSDTPTVTYDGAANDIEDASNNDLADFADQAVANNALVTSGSKGCVGDCSPPTLGVDEQFTRVVENGFTYNGNQINVERYFTPYPLITVDVGKQNTAVFKIYDDSGPDNIRHFDFAFGLDEGQVMGTSNAMIVWDKSHDGTETVTLVDPNNALENVKVLTSEGKCKADSTTNGCLIISVSHTFRESLDFDIVGTNVWDYSHNAWQNFYNHGIHIEGESLNPPDEYVGYCHTLLCNSIKGKLVHLIETGKNTAVDEQGNTWTFDNTWIQDYVSKGKIEDPMTSQGYDRDHVKFNTIKQEQELVASSLFEKYYKTSVSDEPDFAEIDDIKFYELPDTIDKKFDPVLLAKMHKEDIRAQKYLEEMFAKMYPGKVFAE